MFLINYKIKKHEKKQSVSNSPDTFGAVHQSEQLLHLNSLHHCSGAAGWVSERREGESMKLHRQMNKPQAANRYEFHQEQSAMLVKEIQTGLKQLKKIWAKESINWGHVGSLSSITDKLEDINATIKDMTA